jgi:hypothetical protein
MSPASSDASMLAVAIPAPLRLTLLAVHSCTRQHANLLVPGQIVSGLVMSHHMSLVGLGISKRNFAQGFQVFKMKSPSAQT